MRSKARSTPVMAMESQHGLAVREKSDAASRYSWEQRHAEGLAARVRRGSILDRTPSHRSEMAGPFLVTNHCDLRRGQRSGRKAFREASVAKALMRMRAGYLLEPDFGNKNKKPHRSEA